MHKKSRGSDFNAWPLRNMDYTFRLLHNRRCVEASIVPMYYTVQAWLISDSVRNGTIIILDAYSCG